MKWDYCGFTGHSSINTNFHGALQTQAIFKWHRVSTLNPNGCLLLYYIQIIIKCTPPTHICNTLTRIDACVFLLIWLCNRAGRACRKNLNTSKLLWDLDRLQNNEFNNIPAQMSLMSFQDMSSDLHRFIWYPGYPHDRSAISRLQTEICFN